MDSSVYSSLEYKQKSDACVLGSYAIAAYPFVKMPIINFFYGYCKHYGISASNPEECYASHFHSEWNLLSVPGYHFIYCIHTTSTQEIFSICRRQFTLQMINDVAVEKKEIEAFLKQNDQAMITVFMNNIGHSLTIGHDESGFYKYDINIGHVERGFKTLSDLGTTGNGFKLHNKTEP